MWCIIEKARLVEAGKYIPCASNGDKTRTHPVASHGERSGGGLGRAAERGEEPKRVYGASMKTRSKPGVSCRS